MSVCSRDEAMLIPLEKASETSHSPTAAVNPLGRADVFSLLAIGADNIENVNI